LFSLIFDAFVIEEGGGDGDGIFFLTDNLEKLFKTIALLYLSTKPFYNDIYLEIKLSLVKVGSFFNIDFKCFCVNFLFNLKNEDRESLF
jgi:hypothetical protein